MGTGEAAPQQRAVGGLLTTPTSASAVPHLPSTTAHKQVYVNVLAAAC